MTSYGVDSTPTSDNVGENVDPYTQIENADALALVVNAVQKCERDYHNEFVRKLEKRYLAYRGLMQDDGQGSSDPTEQWRSQITTRRLAGTRRRPRCRPASHWFPAPSSRAPGSVPMGPESAYTCSAICTTRTMRTCDLNAVGCVRAAVVEVRPS